ncbi:MAG: trypsin-like peptidase domain-containing protein [Oscillospiraceae bacterium]|nr:trypsin-like peptidase domain-containing protein [Oscillospiraceae bacterium]
MYFPNQDFDHKGPERPEPPKRKFGGKIVALCLCCALLGGAAGLGGGLVAGMVREDRTPQTVEQSRPVAEPLPVVSTPAGQLSASQVYAENVDACVGITVSTTTNIYGYTTTSAATGSGFVISDTGYIITNHHVIEKAANDPSVPITVTFQNGDSYKAKLVGSEAENDVAVLKIQAQGLQAVKVGDSDKLVVGEPVYAIGNPLGELTYTLTDGLVSALDRVITTGSGNNANSMNMLQTNCAINSGNSGGPLFNSKGEVIGITTAKMSSSESAQASVEGLGFAIPINDVKNIIADLVEHGYVTGKPYMGVTVSSVTAADAQRYNLQVGAYVETVEQGSCAEKAGLQVGDIITAMEDTVITTHSTLVAAKSTYRAGDTVTLKIIRNHQPMELQITFDEEEPAAQQPQQQQQTQQSQQQQQTQPGNPYGNQYGNGFGSFFGWPFSNFFG